MFKLPFVTRKSFNALYKIHERDQKRIDSLNEQNEILRGKVKSGTVEIVSLKEKLQKAQRNKA